MTTVSTHTMMPLGTKSPQTTVVNGRSYSCSPGSVLNLVSYQDADALEANGWIKASTGGAGTTALRPTATYSGGLLPAGYRFFDTTLGYEVIWDGAAWRNPGTGASV